MKAYRPTSIQPGIIAKYAIAMFHALVFFASGSLHAEEWLKVTIKKAFISRATFEANRDIFTEPEFGWRVASEKQIYMRGDLYGDYFLPKSKDMELTLIEKDILSDDVVQTFPLEATPGIKKFESGEDEFSIDVGPFFPNAKSGSDATNPTALLPGILVNDSVSFRDQDMTDTFTTDGRLTLIAQDFPSIDIKGVVGCKSVAEVQRNFSVVECSSGKHTITIQATPGSFTTKYSIVSTANPGALLPQLDKITENQPYKYDSAFHLLSELAPHNGVHELCQASTTMLCLYSNYRLADTATRTKMEAAANTTRTKEVLERARLDLPQD